MDRLQAMEMFVRVVETGSFSKAAKEFATTQPPSRNRSRRSKRDSRLASSIATRAA